MKKILFSAILLVTSLASNAQLSKGDVMIGGSLANFNFKFDKFTSLSITPNALWFIQDGLAVGGYAKFGFNHDKGASGSIYSYGIGPSARYYISNHLNLSSQAQFFLEANAGFEGENNTVIDSTTNGLGFGFGPGITYFINSNIGLEAKLKYEGLVGFGSDTYTNGLALSVGFQIYLPSKKIANTINQYQ